MALVTKQDLVRRGAHFYTWKAVAAENPEIIGKPDSGRGRRTDGYEAVDYINALADKHTLMIKTAAYKIEDMLHAAPFEVRSEISAWIEKNWHT